MREATIAFAIMIAAGPASAATTALQDFSGTVDAWNPGTVAKARQAAQNAGYRSTVVEFVQDGNVFLTAARADQVYEVTLTRSGKLFVSTGMPEVMPHPTG